LKREGEFMSVVTPLLLCLALGVATIAPAAANAQTFQTLYSFTGSPDGRFPEGVVFDTAGNLYGTTLYNGSSTACGSAGCGAVFKLAPPPTGQTGWTETLYSFTGSPDGANPYAGLVFMNGALYGTAGYGGDANSTTCVGGCGTAFEFNPTTQALSTLYAFTGAGGSGGPYAELAFNSKGALYGTTEGGNNANHGQGGVFGLRPPAWTFSKLYTFPKGNPEVTSGVVIDKAGNLYGTTGSNDSATSCTKCGSVYEFNPTTRAVTTLYAFTGGADGGDPKGGLTILYLTSSTFVLYGTTSVGGASNGGTVFELNPTTQVLTTLYAFTGGADGRSPSAGLVLDKAFNLYGTTLYGGNTADCGTFLGCGTVFELNPTTGVLTTLETFTGGADGGAPLGKLVFDRKGALYGTTYIGGDNSACPDNSGFLNVPANAPPGCGTVFKLTP
jgi:uncharacterized repeat protein (TIGR03803 family)